MRVLRDDRPVAAGIEVRGASGRDGHETAAPWRRAPTADPDGFTWIDHGDRWWCARLVDVSIDDLIVWSGPGDLIHRAVVPLARSTVAHVVDLGPSHHGRPRRAGSTSTPHCSDTSRSTDSNGDLR